MPGLVPGIHDFLPCDKDVDGRDRPGHDVERMRYYSEPLAAFVFASRIARQTRSGVSGMSICAMP
jgi:hypothetical protein